MKKKKESKRKKKKDEKTEDEIKPSKHENFGNLNFYSEEVANEIINKILSLTFTSINMQKMNKIIDEYYVMNLLNTMNTILEIYYMNHDMDIYFPLNTDINNKSLIEVPKKEKLRRKMEEKKIYNKNEKNDKDELIIEKTYKDEIDMKYLNKHTLLYDAEISNQNFWGTIIEPQSFSFERTSTYKNVIKEGNNYNLNKEIIIPSLESSKRKKFIRLKTKYSSFIGRKLDDIYKSKKKTFIKPTDDLPSERISDEILGIIPEDDDIKIMRKQLLEEINIKNLEEKRERERKRMEEIASKNKGKKKSKNDENENGLNPDLFIKEFIPISSNQKEIKAGSTKEKVEEEKKQLTKKARKNIEYNIIQKVKTKKELMKESLKLFTKKYILNQSEFNLEDDYNEPKGNLRPSGSNFGIIKPEIGVIIQENSKVKSGGINFLEKYNKFSFNDFNRTMNAIFEKNLTNINSYDINVYSTSKNFMINNNYLNNTTTLFNNKTTTSFGEKKKGIEDKEFNEKKLFRKTFMNKLTNLKKKYIYKSKSEIYMSNNININLFREALSDNSNYYNSYNLLDTNKTNNELSYTGKNKLIHKNYFSPVPKDILRTYKNTLLKDYFYNTGNNLTFRKIKTDKYNIMDTFNKNLVDGNNKFNKLLYKKMMENTNNDFLPKINNNNHSIMSYKGTRTKNYFFRSRKKENHK